MELALELFTTLIDQVGTNEKAAPLGAAFAAWGTLTRADSGAAVPEQWEASLNTR